MVRILCIIMPSLMGLEFRAPAGNVTVDVCGLLFVCHVFESEFVRTTSPSSLSLCTRVELHAKCHPYRCKESPPRNEKPQLKIAS